MAKVLDIPADEPVDIRSDQLPPEAASHIVRRLEAKPPKMVNGYEILTGDYLPPHFVFEGLLHNGVTLACGRPKVGKSWLALQLALDTAIGRRGLGKFPCAKPEGVLYIALEESAARTSNRMKKFIARDSSNAAMTGNLEFIYELDPLLNGGIVQLDAVLSTRHFGLVVIDTYLAALRQQRAKNADAIQEDYKGIKALQEVAQRYQTAILLIHHTRKMSAEYALDRVAGTTGLTAAADAIWVLDRGPRSTMLTIQGRDMADSDFAVFFDQNNDTFGWSVTSTGDDMRRSSEREDILELLSESSKPMTPVEIAKELKRGRGGVRSLLLKMRKDGAVAKTDKGYRLV